MLEFLLPRTDGGVAAQSLVAIALLAVLLFVLIRSGRSDGAWLAAGIGSIWLAFSAFRALH